MPRCPLNNVSLSCKTLHVIFCISSMYVYAQIMPAHSFIVAHFSQWVTVQSHRTMSWLLSSLHSYCRDRGWFFKPQLFPIKVILLKRGTVQLSNAKKNLARSIKERPSYRSSKLSSFENSLLPSPWERADLTAPSGSLFHPDRGSFAYIPTSRCRRSTQADSLPNFSFQVFMYVHCVLALFAFIWTHGEGAIITVLKDNHWHDVIRNFGMGELRGPGEVQLLSIDSGLSRGQLQGRGAWFGDSLKLKADPQTSWPNAGKASACFVPLHSLLLGLKL